MHRTKETFLVEDAMCDNYWFVVLLFLFNVVAKEWKFYTLETLEELLDFSHKEVFDSPFEELIFHSNNSLIPPSKNIWFSLWSTFWFQPLRILPFSPTCDITHRNANEETFWQTTIFVNKWHFGNPNTWKMWHFWFFQNKWWFHFWNVLTPNCRYFAYDKFNDNARVMCSFSDIWSRPSSLSGRMNITGIENVVGCFSLLHSNLQCTSTQNITNNVKVKNAHLPD